jgi:hypothetical protein
LVLLIGKPVLVITALSNILSTVALILLSRVVALRFSPTTAIRSVALLCASPGALFFQVGYSESLFLFLLVLLYYGLTTRKLAPSVAASLLLPLTRGVGLFMTIPLGIELALVFRNWNRKGHKPTSVFTLFRLIWQAESHFRLLLLSLVSIVVGWAIYLALMLYLTGNAFEGFEAQKYWGRHSIVHLVDVVRFVREFSEPLYWHEFAGSFLDRVMFVVALIGCVGVWASDRLLLPWVYSLAVLPAMSGMFTSYTRFVAVAFPIYLGLAILSSGRAGKVIAVVCGLAMFACQTILVWRFVNFRWAG